MDIFDRTIDQNQNRQQRSLGKIHEIIHAHLPLSAADILFLRRNGDAATDWLKFGSGDRFGLDIGGTGQSHRDDAERPDRAP
jgi:hypothetical protein